MRNCCKYYKKPQCNSPYNYNSSDTLDRLCDNEEVVIYNSIVPVPRTLKVYNRGDCPILASIYYTEGFVVKRLGVVVQPQTFHNFDTVYSTMRITIICYAIGCSNCNMKDIPNHCLVDYEIYS